MDKKLYLITTIFLAILIAPAIGSAVCTVTFDKDAHAPLETILAEMSCSGNEEKSKAYTLTWVNSTGSTIETDTGTTPATAGQSFFESYSIPSGYSGLINATLTGSSLEGTDYTNVSAAGSDLLIVNNFEYTSVTDIFIGKTIGMEFTVKDENNKKISGAECTLAIEDSSDFPIISKDYNSHAGKIHGNFFLSTESFKEDRQYLAKLYCYCGKADTDSACVDEDGTEVTLSSGEGSGAFEINKWLNVNTVTDKSLYHMKNEIFICANVTNVESTSRVPMNIYHQIRCSAGEDNDADTDRALIITDDDEPDRRGISTGSTQMQCKRFYIPEARYLQGRNSECYASTEVWVLDEGNNEIKGYQTTSPIFNITSDTINVPADWVRTSDYTFNAIVNLSDCQYCDFNATGIGNLDIRLNKINQESSKAQDQYGSTKIDFNTLLQTAEIDTITATYQNGTSIPIFLEFVEDGLLELELRDVDISTTGYYNLTLTFNNFTERSASALEGIENKTGTFAFEIKDIESKANSPGDVDVTISALVEIGASPIEGHFACYVEGYESETKVMWAHAVNNSEAYVTTQTINVPAHLNGGQTMVCKIGETSFTNLITTATKTFQITNGIIDGEVPAEETTIIDKIIDFFKDTSNQIKEIAEEKIDKVKESFKEEPVKSTTWTVIIISTIGGIIYMFWKNKGKNKKLGVGF